MNFKLDNETNLESIKKFAGNYAGKKSPKASKILDVIIKNPERDYLNICFTYLRLIDDFVDDPEISIQKKKIFIEHHKNIISSSLNSDFTPSDIGEYCFYYLMLYAKSNNKLVLIDEVYNMVDALSMDVCRLENSKIFSRCELENYVNLMAKSLFNILITFLYPSLKVDKKIFIGIFTANAQILRDLNEDINAGFLNISKEDVEYYGINLKNPEYPGFINWLKHRIPAVLNSLSDEIILLKKFPLKFRIFTYYSFLYYLPNVIRIKIYNYKTGNIFNKKLIKEIRVYAETIFTFCLIFFRSFFKENNEKNLPELSLKKALKIAGNFARKRAFKSWLAAGIMIPYKRLKFLFLAHYYLRKADDFIDSPDIDIESKNSYIKRELKLIPSLWEEFSDQLIYEEEAYLFYFIQYAKRVSNYNLVTGLYNIIDSINSDLYRLEKQYIFSETELEEYIDKQTRSLFNIIYYFLIPSAKIENRKNYIGKLNWFYLSIRDLDEDLKAGFINISREEIQKYNLNVKDFKNDRNFSLWMKDKHRKLTELLHEEICILKNLPLKIKLFWWASYLPVILMLIKMKANDFHIERRNKKSEIKTVKIYSEFLFLTTKLIFKIYF